MTLLDLASALAFVVSAVVGERFWRRVPSRDGAFVDVRAPFRASSDPSTERWRRRYLVSIAVFAAVAIGTVLEAWPR